MTLYVPERKVWARQPQKIPTVDWANPITAGLEFAFTPVGGLYNAVTGALLTTSGSISIVPDSTGLGTYTSASSDLVSGLIAKSIPTTSPVSAFLVCQTQDANNTVLKRALQLSGATTGVMYLDFTTNSGDSNNSALFQDSSGGFPSRNFSSYSANTLYSSYIAHSPGDTYPTFVRNGVTATNTGAGLTANRIEAITQIRIGNTGALGRPLKGNVFCVFVFSRLLSAAERKSLEANPWQLFAPRRQWFAFQPLNKLYVPERKVWTRQPQTNFVLDNNLPIPSFCINFADTACKNLLQPSYTPAGTINKATYDNTVGLKGTGASGSSGFVGYLGALFSGTHLLIVLNFVTPPLNGQMELLCERTNNSNNYFSYLPFWLALHADGNTGAFSTTKSAFTQYGPGSGYGSIEFNTPEIGKEHTLAICIDTSLAGYSCVKWLYIDGKKITTTGVLNTRSTGFFNTGNDLYFNARGTTSLKSSNHLNLAAFYNFKTNEELAQKLSANPWQLFAPRRQLFALSQVTNVQLLYPSSDISTGSWTPSTGTTLYGTIDETPYSDSDYIETSTTTSCEIKFSAGASPSSRNNHIIKYRMLPGTGVLTMTLKCGSTTITTWEHTLTASTQSIENTLTVGEATSITDYSDLRIVATVS